MKKLVWIAGVVLLLAVVYPNGIKLPVLRPTPTVPADVEIDSAVVAALTNATAEDKAHVAGIYDGMLQVLKRDNGARIKTTEKWADFQTNTLHLAVETVGEYSGLDVAIENVFKTQLGTDDVLPTNPETQKKLAAACQIISASASK